MANSKQALAALRAGDHAAARDALVAVWQKRRSPVIAELVAILDAHAPDARSAQIAAIVTPRATSSLANLRALAKVDDPRLAAWAIDALVRLPFTAVTARDFLVAVAKTAARHDDPRLAARAREISVAVSTRIGRLAIRKELQAIVDRAVARMPAVAKAELAIEQELAALVEPLRGGARSADALLAEIYANPADDAPRLVYADLLTAKGDPRGEFIVLQLERGDGEPSAREQELLKRHGKAWLGDLAPVLTWGKGYATTAFRRGFVSTADIILSKGKKLQPILTHPAWATVEKIDGLLRDDDGLLVHAPLRALRMLDVDRDSLPALAARKEKLAAVVRIEIPSWQPADAALLRAAFPSVETLFVRVAAVTPADIAKFTALGIDQVELRHGMEPAGPAALAALAAVAQQLVGTPAPVARLTLLHTMSKTSDRFELHRDAHGNYTPA